jgi:hypothetical protein
MMPGPVIPCRWPNNHVHRNMQNAVIGTKRQQPHTPSTCVQRKHHGVTETKRQPPLTTPTHVRNEHQNIDKRQAMHTCARAEYEVGRRQCTVGVRSRTSGTCVRMTPGSGPSGTGVRMTIDRGNRAPGYLGRVLSESGRDSRAPWYVGRPGT